MPALTYWSSSKLSALSACLALTCALAPALASAQPTLTRPTTIELEAAFAHARWVGDAPRDMPDAEAPVSTQASGGVGAYARIRALTSPLDADDALLFDVDLAWRFWAGEFAQPVAGVVCCRLLNPYVGGSLGWQSDTMRVRGGLGLTLPVANTAVSEGSAERLLWEFADVAFGYRDGWLTMGETMAFVVRADWEARFDGLRLGAEAALALMVPVFRPRAAGFEPIDGNGPFTRYQVFLSISGVIDPYVEFGLRAGLAGWTGMSLGSPTSIGRTRLVYPPGEGSTAPGQLIDDAQVSVTPFVRVRFLPGYLEARGTLLLDHPNGVESTTTHLSLALAGGVELD